MGLWLAPIHSPEVGKRRLICFPFGGGGVASFRDWQRALSLDIELYAVRLPGRETRMAEPFESDPARVCKAIADEFANLAPLPTAFYGHSLGAALAVQTANVLRSGKCRLPSLLILSGRMPPHCGYIGKWADRPDADLLAYLTQIGGLPEEVLRNPVFLSTYLPKIRADFLLNDNMQYERTPPFPFPITIVNGGRDPILAGNGLEGWREYTSEAFASYRLEGSHFFFQISLSEFIRILSRELDQMAQTRERGPASPQL